MIKIDGTKVIAIGTIADTLNETESLFKAAMHNETLMSAMVLAMNKYQEDLTELFVEHLKNDPDMLSDMEESDDSYVN